MTELTRREALATLAAAAAGGAVATGVFACGPAEVDRATREAARTKAGGKFTPRFFTADERSGGASDAGVPEFLDFVLAEEMTDPVRVRGGLAWLDSECTDRFSRRFVEADESQRGQVLDDIAWPGRARPELSQGAAFFTAFRDLVASGFWSSKVGVEDLGYRGNVPLAEWTGCPEEQLRKLGVSYG